jgi:hypothetical protein
LAGTRTVSTIDRQPRLNESNQIESLFRLATYYTMPIHTIMPRRSILCCANNRAVVAAVDDEYLQTSVIKKRFSIKEEEPFVTKPARPEEAEEAPELSRTDSDKEQVEPTASTTTATSSSSSIFRQDTESTSASPPNFNSMWTLKRSYAFDESDDEEYEESPSKRTRFICLEEEQEQRDDVEQDDESLLRSGTPLLWEDRVGQEAEEEFVLVYAPPPQQE